MKNLKKAVLLLALMLAVPAYAGREGGSAVGGGGGDGSGNEGFGKEGGSAVGGGDETVGDLDDRGGIAERLSRLIEARTTNEHPTCIAAFAEIRQGESVVRYRVAEMPINDSYRDLAACMRFGAQVHAQSRDSVKERRTLVQVQGVDNGMRKYFDDRDPAGF